MPFANEHAARQTDPEQYDEFRRTHPDGFPDGIDAILGIKGDKSEVQIIRAKADAFTVEEFKAWLEEHDMKSEVEEATGEEEAEEKEGTDEESADAEIEVEEEDEEEETESMSSVVHLSLLAPASAPTSFRLFKAGWNETSKGSLLYDALSADKVSSRFRTSGMDMLPLDYAHAMLSDKQTSETAKAAGWFTPTTRNGELWADKVQWTKKAKTALSNREFRYISPAIELDDDRRVVGLINVALTNLPATRGLTPLVASQTPRGAKPKDTTMATKDKALPLENNGQAVLLAEQGGAIERVLLATRCENLDAVATKMAQLETVAAEAVKLSARVNELESGIENERKAAIIAKLSTDGKAAPATHGFLRTLTLAQLQSYAEIAPVVIPSSTKPLADDSKPVVTEEEQAILAQFGGMVKAEKFAETKRAMLLDGRIKEGA